MEVAPPHLSEEEIRTHVANHFDGRFIPIGFTQEDMVNAIIQDRNDEIFKYLTVKRKNTEIIFKLTEKIVIIWSKKDREFVQAKLKEGKAVDVRWKEYAVLMSDINDKVEHAVNVIGIPHEDVEFEIFLKFDMFLHNTPQDGIKTQVEIGGEVVSHMAQNITADIWRRIYKPSIFTNETCRPAMRIYIDQAIFRAKSEILKQYDEMHYINTYDRWFGK